MITKELLDTVVSQLAKPALLELCQETGQSILVKVSVKLDSNVVVHEVCNQTKSDANVAQGEFRVILRDSATPSVFNFNVECVIEGLAPTTGFSGFVMRGKITVNDNATVVRVIARTNRYNVWNWSKEFNF